MPDAFRTDPLLSSEGRAYGDSPRVSTPWRGDAKRDAGEWPSTSLLTDMGRLPNLADQVKAGAMIRSIASVTASISAMPSMRATIPRAS